MQLPKEMYKTYVERRGEDCKQLSEALQKNDHTVFRKVGHQLRGNATSFGFDELTQLADRMHEVNEENFSKIGPGILQDLGDWVNVKKRELNIS
jgi:HPt (histidine-containing phosphotransfer) domain-containing protein